MNKEFIYDQNSVRLLVEGIPDSSCGHDNNVIGILTSWKLQIFGYPELEGKKEHLQNLMSVILGYTRNYITGVRSSFGDEQSQIRISPTANGHKILLISSKDGVKPLELNIDDAELLDLTRASRYSQSSHSQLILDFIINQKFLIIYILLEQEHIRVLECQE